MSSSTSAFNNRLHILLFFKEVFQNEMWDKHTVWPTRQFISSYLINSSFFNLKNKTKIICQFKALNVKFCCFFWFYMTQFTHYVSDAQAVSIYFLLLSHFHSFFSLQHKILNLYENRTTITRSRENSDFFCATLEQHKSLEKELH